MGKNNAKSITSQLWAMANKLRGTMDASEYKNYILPFMFYRYLSERQDKYIENDGLEEFYALDPEKDQEEIDLYVKDIVTQLGYAILPQYSWRTLVANIQSHKIGASYFHEMFDAFNESVKRNPHSMNDFEGIFADVNLGDSRLGSNLNERSKALFDIVEMINEFEFKDESGKDILGDVYEYLIGEFAATAGKKGGEFYTPHEVSVVLAKLVTLGVKDDGSQFRVYDPTMGSGSLLLTVQKELEFGERRGAVDFYGQELNTTTFNLARMNLMMHGVNYMNMTLRRGDTLAQDWPSVTDEGIETPTLFDAVVANPPYSQKWDSNLDKDPRFKAGMAPKSRADFAFVQHSLYHLDNNGTMAIVLPHGVLFRGGAEAKIREQLIRENKLDAVIGLPANLFYGTGIPTCVLVFKGSEAKKTKDILFIDASQAFDKVKNKNTLSKEHIEEIISTYEKREFVDKYAYVADLKEIQENDFNLNIPRYVDTFEEEEVVPLGELVDNLSEIDQEINESTKTLLGMMQELTSEDEETRSELNKFIEWLQK